jgi:predicted esterase
VSTPGAAAREVPIVVPRSARFYVLGDADAASPPAELWIALHGYGQLAARFVPHFAPVAGPSRLVVAPEALNRFYVSGPAGSAGTRDHAAARVGATWMTREDREREIADQHTYLDAVLAAVLAPWRGSLRPRLVVFGFSQGVATAVRWMARDGVGADRLVAWGGSFPAELDAPTVARFLAGRTTVVNGRTDELVPSANVEAELARLRTLGLEPHVVWHDRGHTLDAPTLVSIAQDVSRA